MDRILRELVTIQQNGERVLSQIVQKLRRMDLANDSDGYVRLALSATKELGDEELMLLVFHAWRAGQLESLGRVLRALRHEDSLAFFLSHELKTRGDQRQAYHTLRSLAKISKSPIVQFRYLNEALNFESLSVVKSEMEIWLALLPVVRQTALLFNYGNAEIQTGNLSGAEQIRRQLLYFSDSVAIYFATWLEAAILEYRAQYRESLKAYQRALNLCEKLPARRIDISVLSFCIVEQAFWCGQLTEARDAFEKIRATSSEGVSHLSTGRTAIASALVKILEGQLGEARSTLIEEFRQPTLDIHHLQGAFYLLWLLFTCAEYALLRETILRLMEARERLHLASDFFDFDAFLVVADHFLQKREVEETETSLTKLETQKIYSSTSFPFKWTRIFRHLILSTPILDRSEPASLNIGSGLQALVESTEFCVLQRFLVLWIGQTALGKSLEFWRRAEQTASCEVARQVAKIQVCRDQKDLLGFVEATCSPEGRLAINWIYWTDDLGADFTYERAIKSQSCQLAWDPVSRRCLAVSTGANLQGQSQIQELLGTMLENGRPVTKEKMAKNLGILEYHPLNHDPLIHANIQRLRDWLKKNAPKIEVVRQNQGWAISRPELVFTSNLHPQNEIQKTHFDSEAKQAPAEVAAWSTAPAISQSVGVTTSLPSIGSTKVGPLNSSGIKNQGRDLPWIEGLNIRQLWILQFLKGHAYINRQILMEQFDVEKSTVAMDFRSLVEQGYINKGGAARSTFYRLAKDVEV